MLCVATTLALKSYWLARRYYKERGIMYVPDDHNYGRRSIRITRRIELEAAYHKNGAWKIEEFSHEKQLYPHFDLVASFIESPHCHQEAVKTRVMRREFGALPRTASIPSIAVTINTITAV